MLSIGSVIRIQSSSNSVRFMVSFFLEIGSLLLFECLIAIRFDGVPIALSLLYGIAVIPDQDNFDESMESLQEDLEKWLIYYNSGPPHRSYRERAKP